MNPEDNATSSPRRTDAVEEAIERKDELSQTSDASAASHAAERATRALEGANLGRVPEGDYVGAPVRIIVYARDGSVLAQPGEAVTPEMIERAKRDGIQHDLYAAIDPPSLRAQ